MALPKVTFRSSTSNGAAPLSCGHLFRRGDVPAGSSLAGVQCTSKTTWSDGSLKFAVLAASSAITGGTPLDFQLSLGAAVAGAAVSLADLKATGVTASIGCGAFGTVSWATTDWDSPFQIDGQAAWVSGPIMSSWVYRKPVGTDAHLVAWLEVRMWANGAVEVLPWIENGYMFVAGPTNKNATYTFSLGGSQRFTLPINVFHHQRTPLINGAALSYWLGADPGISVSHDKVYMQSSELVPSYRTMRSATGLATLPTTWFPFSRGGILYTDNRDGDDVMKNPGWQRPIGLIGEHDAAYLFCNDQPELLYAALIRNGFTAGRYPIHYRDETTNRAPVLLTYQELTVDNPSVSGIGAGNQTTPTPTGGSTTIWDGAHHPECAAVPYMVTGHFYHLETLQLINAGNFFTMNCLNARAGGNRGRFIPDYESVQTRQAAWGMRTLALTAALTPDNDTAQRASVVGVLNLLIDYYHATFIAQPNNQFGFIEPGESTYRELWGSYTGGQMIGPWQDDFFTASWGYALAMGLPVDATRAAKHAEFFAWKARTVIGRLGASNSFRFENCDPYTMSVSSAVLPDYQGGTGPWRASWKAIYDETLYFETGRGQTWLAPVVDNNVSGEFDITVWPRAMLGNMMPALAYARRFGVPDAEAANTRLTSAANWPAIQSSFVANAPHWDITTSGATSTPGGTLSGTPGPHAAFTNQPPRGAGRGVFGKRHTKGAPISDIPTGGTNGVSALRAIIENTDDPAIELRIHYTSKPAGFVSDGLGGYSYSGSLPATVAYDIYRGGEAAAIGSATDTIASSSGSTVSGVVVSPATATGSATFSAVVNGTGSPSQSVTWSRSGTAGSINASTGAWTAPAATSVQQVITITATSVQDNTKTGTATVTIAAVVPGSTVSGVAVSPASGTVAGGGVRNFTAIVSGTNSPSQAVSWATNLGTINPSTGQLVAPAATSVQQTGTVTATSTQDPTKSNTATFTVAAVVAPPAPGVTVISVNVTPNGGTLSGGATRQYSAAVVGNNGPDQGVTWSCDIGAIDTSGLYTPPVSTFLTRLATVTATSTFDPTKKGVATVTIAALTTNMVVAENNMLVLDADGYVANTGPDTFVERGREYWIDKDPDAKLAYGIDLSDYLTRAGQGITLVAATAKIDGVTPISDVRLQGNTIVVQLDEGKSQLIDIDAVNRCTFHFTLSNGDENERSINFAIVDN